MMKFGRPHRHLEICDSTNDVAREWALDPVDPAPSGALVTADFQKRTDADSAGMSGRRKRAKVL